ncbi:MAG TPA: metallophosphoesterase, partial [Acidobacteriota bacterium]|nr:metallophosphoesterase [Acidobacteriota bacterium]
MKTPGSRLRVLLAGPILLTLVLALALRAAEIPCVWTGVDRVVAVGDLHGDYGNFVKILKGTGIVDGRLAWAGGTAHLVQTGDILDRGPEAKEIFDLLRRLEPEAAKAGGMVHVLLGNHEELNITGIAFDYPDYITVEQFVAFLPRNYRRDREREFLKTLQAPFSHRTEDAVDADIKVKLRERWLELMKTDRGHRAYLSGFNEGYGKWLLEKNAVIKINDTIFVHGGISEKYSTWKLGTINDRLRRELAFFMGRERVLLSYVRPFKAEIVYDSKGPLWYRDLATRDEGEIRGDLEHILENLGAKSMVIAHTFYRGNGMSPVVSAQYMSRFDGRLWTIDTGISHYYGGVNSALIIEQGKFVLWGGTDGVEEAAGAPPPAGASVPGCPDIEEFLRTATVGTIVRGAERG